MKQDFTLTDEQLQQFHNEGYIGPFRVYTEKQTGEMLKEIRAQLFTKNTAPYAAPMDSAISNYDRHLDIELLSKHIFRPEIVDRLKRILGENIVCWRSEFIPKRPGAEGTDWHQAENFSHGSGKPQLQWPEGADPDGCINVWMAFTEANEETACMQFIPGTQEDVQYDESIGLRFDPKNNIDVVKNGVKRGFNGYDYRVLQKDPNWKPDESKAIPIIMKPGEIVIFRSRLLHSSKPNSSKTKTRLGYVARYVPGDVRVYPDTEHVEEFGGKFSLENYGVVEVLGKNLIQENRVKKFDFTEESAV